MNKASNVNERRWRSGALVMPVAAGCSGKRRLLAALPIFWRRKGVALRDQAGLALGRRDGVKKRQKIFILKDDLRVRHVMYRKAGGGEVA